MFVSYVELHCHSAYSFLDGASHPVELAGTAAEQGHAALALTDHDGLHGAMEMAQALQPLGVRPITGAELTLDDGTHLTLLCETREGYTNLCRLITASHWRTRRWAREGWTEPAPGTGVARAGPARRRADISLDDIEPLADGLVCLSGCARDGAVARAGRGRATTPRPRRWRAGCCGPSAPSASGSSSSVRSARHDRRRNRLLARAGRAARSALRGHRQRARARARARSRSRTRWWRCGLGTTLDETEPSRRGNSSHVLAPPERMAERFREHPDAVEESGAARRAARASTSPRTSATATPARRTRQADRKLAELCRDALRASATAGRSDAGRARLDEELRVIRHLGLSGFFLLHRDLLELAREVAAEVRGPESARAPAAARARARLERVVDRLLPHRASRTWTRSRTSCSSGAS